MRAGGPTLQDSAILTQAVFLPVWHSSNSFSLVPRLHWHRPIHPVLLSCRFPTVAELDVCSISNIEVATSDEQTDGDEDRFTPLLQRLGVRL